MSRARGADLQNALASYLSRWWRYAESAGAGRTGRDILGTPGVAWECKTADEWRVLEWMRQARSHAPVVDADGRPAELSVVAYWPRGSGERSVAAIPAILPLGQLMIVLEDGGWAPGKDRP